MCHVYIFWLLWSGFWSQTLWTMFVSIPRESFSQIWFCLIRIAKKRKYLVYYHKPQSVSSCNVRPPPHPIPPHSISDKHRPRYRLTFSSITMSGGCLMRSVAAKQNHKKSHQTRADEIRVCLLSSLCLTARQHLLTHWYDACCAVSLTPLGVSVSSHFSSHRAERVKRGRLAELHSHE